MLDMAGALRWRCVSHRRAATPLTSNAQKRACDAVVYEYLIDASRGTSSTTRQSRWWGTGRRRPRRPP